MTALVAHRPVAKIRPVDVRPLRAVSNRPPLDIPRLPQPSEPAASPAQPARPRVSAAAPTASRVSVPLVAARVSVACLGGVIAGYGIQLMMML